MQSPFRRGAGESSPPWTLDSRNEMESHGVKVEAGPESEVKRGDEAGSQAEKAGGTADGRAYEQDARAHPSGATEWNANVEVDL